MEPAMQDVMAQAVAKQLEGTFERAVAEAVVKELMHGDPTFRNHMVGALWPSIESRLQSELNDYRIVRKGNTAPFY